MLKIYAYKPGSKSAKDLAEQLGVRRLKHQGSRWRPRPNDTVINWGSGNCPYTGRCNVLNDPSAVYNASRKDVAFMLMEHTTRVPAYTESREVAAAWLNEGEKVVCRTMLRASSGRGIVLANTPEELVPAPLYVQYIKKQEEYRVHVFGGHVIDVQQKKRTYDVPDDQVNWQIRNHGNGFIYARQELQPPEDVITQAKAAIQALNLDFGAVDVIWNNHQQRAYVLEVNTAPGLTGTTLENYTRLFEEYK